MSITLTQLTDLGACADQLALFASLFPAGVAQVTPEACVAVASRFDYCPTRNRHGAGFWDRGLGDLGDQLTDAAHTMGSMDAYIGDGNKVHVT
jgi:hypothetical protein